MIDMLATLKTIFPRSHAGGMSIYHYGKVTLPFLFLHGEIAV